MNWTDLKDIEQKIVEKRYSDSEAFNYFLGTAILHTLGCFLFLEDYENSYKLAVITVRPLRKEEIPLIVSYFFSASPEFLKGM